MFFPLALGQFLNLAPYHKSSSATENQTLHTLVPKVFFERNSDLYFFFPLDDQCTKLSSEILFCNRQS